jgi:hypothetical protein
MEEFRLPVDLATELCRRLEVAWPAGPADLDPLYRAWCARVPLDNIGKALAVAEGRVPPGDDAAAVVEQFLAIGLGGNCWAHVSALAGLLVAAGARATVGLDRMVRADGIVDFHSFVVVHEGDDRWVLDPMWVSGRPLALRAGAGGVHPVIRAAFEGDGEDGRLWHRCGLADRDDVRYAVLSTVLDRDDVRAFCAVSARFSGVPAGILNLRRTTPTACEAVRAPAAGDAPGTALLVRRRTAHDVHDEVFTDPDDAFGALGCAPEARRRAERAGLLAPGR